MALTPCPTQSSSAFSASLTYFAQCQPTLENGIMKKLLFWLGVWVITDTHNYA